MREEGFIKKLRHARSLVTGAAAAAAAAAAQMNGKCVRRLHKVDFTELYPAYIFFITNKIIGRFEIPRNNRYGCTTNSVWFTPNFVAFLLTVVVGNCLDLGTCTGNLPACHNCSFARRYRILGMYQPVRDEERRDWEKKMIRKSFILLFAAKKYSAMLWLCPIHADIAGL